ncbi:DUF5117 domain-containing protein [Chitinophaga silvatica]|uniref:DUF5117 domain-containing protein n=1 Tax=Chitinophaga silvatica TaxID=2282649 RepID=A0A3E1YGY5_9BACT|nr:zinc-dependent metalloprotease [Chitinophaga silvatica]RFS26627.1 DUF5117 domain-containing protein [Chitinophaga silvatica]
MRRFKLIFGITAGMLMAYSANAQLISIKQKDGGITKDTTSKPTAVKQKLKPYKEVIPDSAKTSRGLVIVHKVEDRYFFEIPDKVLGKDILSVTRISKSSSGLRAGMFGYAGDEINENVITLEKGPGNKMFIRTVSYLNYMKDSSAPMYRSVMNSNVQPITASFDIKTYSADGKASVIDVTDFVNGDNELVAFDPSLKSQLKLGGISSDKSYIDTIRTYPMNVEVRTVKTYGRSGNNGASSNVTLEINTSIVMLPEKPMKAREYDKRVGFFAGGFYDFETDPQAVKATYYVRRWRMEPKDGEVEKYLKGELVEPKKPIIIYIDPATPEKWVPYLIQGVNDWQAAFEKAGFKNAIQARRAPTKAEDSTWSIDDARYSAIVYKPSAVPNASGPHVADPRTGEILETHINWYHNVMQLLHNWYFIQCAAVDPRARTMELDDELMGQLIRFVSSHEVGHTLGLRHNFGSSSTVPVENLRNKKWVEEHGHTPSIMDYARFNYVAQPEDNISEKGLFPRIGDYDKWAIEWGYKWLPQFSSSKEEIPYLNKLTIEKLKDKRLWFGSETEQIDPRCQNEDLSDNVMKANAYGIKNLQVVMKNLMEWTKVPNKDYTNLSFMYDQVKEQYVRYINHVAKNVGGIYVDTKTVEQPGAQITPVSAATQKEALSFLKEQLFKAPTWLFDQKIISIAATFPADNILNMQGPVLNKLINGFMMDRLLQFETAQPQNAYPLTTYLADLHKAVGLDNMVQNASNIYQRNLQKLYLEKFNSMLNVKTMKMSEITSLDVNVLLPQGLVPRTNDTYSIVKAYLLNLEQEFKKAAAVSTDPIIKNHFRFMAERIPEIMKPKAENIN